MVKAHLQAVIDGDLKTVWQIIIDNEHYAWRSDLQKIIVADDGQSFTELSKNGMETHFVITVQEYCSPVSYTHLDLILNHEYEAVAPMAQTEDVYRLVARGESIQAAELANADNMDKLAEIFDEQFADDKNESDTQESD